MTPRPLGYVSLLGHLYCAWCAEALELRSATAVFDHPPHNGEPCERCGQVLREVMGGVPTRFVERGAGTRGAWRSCPEEGAP